MSFMREGGFNMWILVLIGASAAAGALLRPQRRRAFLIGGAFLVLVSALFGLATCHHAVAGYFAAHPQATAHDLAVGLRESANNALLGPALALMLGGGAALSR
jgi:hypothetical protein